MKKPISSTFAVVLAAATLVLLPAAANAEPRGCATGSGGRSFSGGFSNGNIGFSWNGGNYDRGYRSVGYERHRSEPVRPSYTERCKLIDTCYFTRGCERYAKKTFLHERIDCHGHVVKCWKTYETVCVGRHHGH